MGPAPPAPHQTRQSSWRTSRRPTGHWSVGWASVHGGSSSTASRLAMYRRLTWRPASTGTTSPESSSSLPSPRPVASSVRVWSKTAAIGSASAPSTASTRWAPFRCRCWCCTAPATRWSLWSTVWRCTERQKAAAGATQ